MDYNIEPGIGTDQHADSAGDGLLEHQRAYLSWLDGIFAEYPDLVIENCGSGGMRMDYAMLKRHSVQSTSDMEDYRMYATIAVNSPLALTPEQAAVWSYPMNADDAEETIFNMVNAVSYTHLDVYKRQTFGWQGRFTSVSAASSCCTACIGPLSGRPCLWCLR